MYPTLLLEKLRERGIELVAENNRLRYRAPKGMLTAELRTQLIKHQSEIVELIRKYNGSRFMISPLCSRPKSKNEHIPLSFGQARIWFLNQLEPDNLSYNIPMAIRLKGLLNVTVLQQSLNEIVRRHEILRATFKVVKEKPTQVVAQTYTQVLSVIDLTNFTANRREAEVQKLAIEDSHTAFDLLRGPILRTTLLRLDEKEHMLLVTMHHIVTDGWSMGLFLNELATFYNAFLYGRPSPLPKLLIQYPDFAYWQQEWLRSDVLKDQLAYWKRQLSGELPKLPLPTSRSLVQNFRAGYQILVLPKSLTDALKFLSHGENVSLFTVLLAAFNVLLYRYTSQENILVGFPIANRNRSEIEQLIGFFVNTLVLRTDLSGNPSFRELLGRVRNVVLDAYANQDLPFERLVQELRPERELGYNPLFQVMFNFLTTTNHRIELPDLSFFIEPRLSVSPGAICDLTFHAMELNGEIQFVLVYNNDLFESMAMAKMLGHFHIILKGILITPEQRLSELSLLTDAEQHLLSVEHNDTRTEFPEHACIQEIFETIAEQAPDTIAVSFEDHQLTYAALNRQANKLANHLRNLGVGPDVLVGIFLERCLEMVVGILGILKAGGAYVPLDPAYPKEHIAYLLDDTKAPVLLTRHPMVSFLPEHEVRVVCLDSEWETISRQLEENPVNGMTAENLAYVIYTSGSTGRPKGVCTTHRNVVRLIKGTNYVDLTSDEVFLQLAPISFDASTFELWGSLLHKARLIILHSHMPTLEELGEALQRFQVTTLWLTASLFHQMVEGPLDNLRQVRQLLAGGDVLSVSHVQKVFRMLTECKLINGYGPTESTTFACCYTIANPCQFSTSIPIGSPIANTQVYLLDQHLQLVPSWVMGELHLGGAGLARGYHNRPELTAEKFIPHPFSEELGARLYKTGDLGRVLSDGNIEFIGRTDYQVKIRGFRIELGEIEMIVTQYPTVQNAVVLAREDILGEKCLVAYVVSTQKPGQSVSELRDFLKQKLPAYMVPSNFVMLDALPLMPNGKVDRCALPLPERERLKPEKNFVAPRTPTEEVIVRIWSSVLGIEQVSVYDNFFELGGHSLLAIQLISRLQDIFLIELPIQSLFQEPTVAGVAEAVENARTSVQKRRVPRIARLDRNLYCMRVSS